MSSRRAFLASLGLGGLGLGLPGAAQAWGRWRRCRPVMCQPTVCQPVIGEPGGLVQGQPNLLQSYATRAASNGDCCYCISWAQIGNTYYYSAYDCTQSFNFGFQSQSTSALALGTTCTCNPITAPCFAWPPPEGSRPAATAPAPNDWIVYDTGYALPTSQVGGIPGPVNNPPTHTMGGATVSALATGSITAARRGKKKSEVINFQVYQLVMPANPNPIDLYVAQECKNCPPGPAWTILEQMGNYFRIQDPNTGNICYLLVGPGAS